MAIIVSFKEGNAGEKFILIGGGYGAYKATRPSYLGGNLFPHEDEGNIEMAAITNKDGDIFWVYSNTLKVVEVDGKRIDEIL